MKRLLIICILSVAGGGCCTSSDTFARKPRAFQVSLVYSDPEIVFRREKDGEVLPYPLVAATLNRSDRSMCFATYDSAADSWKGEGIGVRITVRPESEPGSGVDPSELGTFTVDYSVLSKVKLTPKQRSELASGLLVFHPSKTGFRDVPQKMAVKIDVDWWVQDKLGQETGPRRRTSVAPGLWLVNIRPVGSAYPTAPGVEP